MSTDFTYVSNTEFYGAWDTKLIPYVVGESDDESKPQLYPVTGLGSVMIGSEVCAYGAAGGFLCGSLAETDVELTFPAPGHEADLVTMAGLSKVDLGTNGFYDERDFGGPVYTLSKIGDRAIAQALGHMTHFDNNDPNHKLLYYTPIDKALEGITDNSGPNSNYNCHYALMTYNENNAQEYDKLLAQVEISAKN